LNIKVGPTGAEVLQAITSGRGAPRTRFAPAPTGYLHLGHVVNAVLVWGIARATQGTVLLRVEDHDATRCRPEYLDAMLEDLAWLGLVPDKGGLPHVIRQSRRTALYEGALAQLDAAGLVYACDCSRRLLEDLAPHEANEERPYPGRCRDRNLPRTAGHGLRVRLPDTAVTFDDLLLGSREQVPSAQCGDLLIRDRLGQWTYQFAVVVDDLRQGVDLVVRGQDLLSSTGRQLLLGQLLGRTEAPLYLHHALIRRPDGIKLSKSDGATGIRELRASGLSAADVLGLAVFHAGIAEQRPVTAAELPAMIAHAPPLLDATRTDG
jgi:glutamyl-tRNA synthetase/glutamyl-Q tRNA(Asp) synthetase